MAKKFDEVKKELDAELETVFNRDENKKKQEKIDQLATVRNEIAGKEKEYADALKNEDFDTAVDIQTEIEQLKKKEKIINKLLDELVSKIPDYPYESISGIAEKMITYAKDRDQELLKAYHQKLLDVEKAYNEYADEISSFHFYLQNLNEKSPKRIPYWFQSSPNGASSVSDYIRDAAQGIKQRGE